MRAIVSTLVVCVALLACDTENSARLNASAIDSLEGLAFDDPLGNAANPANAAYADSLIQIRSAVAGTSADGGMVDLLLDYSLDPYLQTHFLSESYIQFEYLVPDQEPILMWKTQLNDALIGEAALSVPTNNESAKLIATVGGLRVGDISGSDILVAQLPALTQRETTDLSLVQEVRAELVEGSYDSRVVDGRRVHDFAIRVIDPSAGPIADLLVNASNTEGIDYSITGLEDNVSTHFTALENGVEDIESPVTVSFTEHPLAVYMVIDRSKSVVESRNSHELLSAVSNTVIALSKNAQFDYRVFNGDVTKIEDIRELDFDSGDTSATAVYHAIDTVLLDIENSGSIFQDKIVMVFTDGKDLASRNHYGNDFIDNEQVHEYIVDRVEQVRRSLSTNLDRQLQVYTIGFYDEASGIDASEEVQKLDAIAQAGGTVASYNNFNVQDIESAFASVVHNVKGVYYLQYSSQQAADNNNLELIVTVNSHTARVILPKSSN